MVVQFDMHCLTFLISRSIWGDRQDLSATFIGVPVAFVGRMTMTACARFMLRQPFCFQDLFGNFWLHFWCLHTLLRSPAELNTWSGFSRYKTKFTYIWIRVEIPCSVNLDLTKSTITTSLWCKSFAFQLCISSLPCQWRWCMLCGTPATAVGKHPTRRLCPHFTFLFLDQPISLYLPTARVILSTPTDMNDFHHLITKKKIPGARVFSLGCPWQ